MFRFNRHHQGAYYSSFLRLLFLNNQLKYIGVVNLVVWPYIQSVTGGMCETSGECSLGQTIPI